MTQDLYNGKHCPCPSDCSRRGNCPACIKFHHDRNEVTYCEHLATKYKNATEEHTAPDGKTIRLLDYGPCAG